ncbi:MAG: ABC transporter ATP-binding protein [Treponema sp.]|nr:ABC transporter ATP-binding protein [Treponema sp.]
MTEEILRVENLTKIYPGGILANFELNFAVNKGEIHALVGENGAGKSTLMKCLFGIEDITSGAMYLDGRAVHFTSSQDAIARGIGMVQQNMMLVPSLTVAENLVLGAEHRRGLFIDRQRCIDDTNAVSAKYNLPVDAEKRVRDISVGMKQKLEILKTMYRGARIIILDEPTAVLAPQDTDELFQQLLNLKEQGYTIIFISHKLGEVKYLCDRLTVLKAGKTVGTFTVSDITVEEISRRMVGRDIKIAYKKKTGSFGEKVLQVSGLTYTDKFGSQKLKGVSFSLRRGEILGIAGIEGNGQLELMNIMTGNLRADSGKALYGNTDILKEGIGRIRESGIAHIPEDRAYNGSAPDMNVRDNLTATCLKQFTNMLGLLRQGSMEEYCGKCVKDYQIMLSSLDAPIRSLSGGNIQKVVVAREFSGTASVIMLNQPTRGVDVGAMEFIHNKILEMRELGKSMILVSSDLTELKALSDRIVVLFQGRIAGLIDDVPAASEEDLGLYMLGLKTDPEDRLALA